MRIPFTIDQFLRVFEEYNRAIWPAQALAYFLGVAAIGLALTGRPRFVSAILGVLWLWNGVSYQYSFFRQINPAAVVFAALFAIQGFSLLLQAITGDGVRYAPEGKPAAWIGAILMAYAMVAYPLLNTVFGHPYPAMPVFGVAPCPTTIFTMGLLVWGGRSVSGYSLVIPVVWSAVGAVAAIQLGMLEDFALPLSAVILVVIRLVDARVHGHGAKLQMG